MRWLGNLLGYNLRSGLWKVIKIMGRKKDMHGVWIPIHTKNGRAYVRAPPPIVAGFALEECLKAVHKQTDAYHVFLVPRLYSPLWLCMFYKLSNVLFHISPGNLHWPAALHKPLFVGITLLSLSRSANFGVGRNSVSMRYIQNIVPLEGTRVLTINACRQAFRKP